MPEADYQDSGFEEQLLQAIFINEQISYSDYNNILQRLKEKVLLSEALKEYGAITPELLSTCNDCNALIDQGTVSVSQLMVAIYDYQTANIPIKESLTNRGWLSDPFPR